MSKHTAGPWKWVDMRNGNEARDPWINILHHTHEGTDNPDGRWIGPVAELKYLNKRQEQYEADATLIAAAPDLLEAAQAAHVAMVALGNHLNWPADPFLPDDPVGQPYSDAINSLRDAIAKATPGTDA